jgi:hypothetical protein
LPPAVLTQVMVSAQMGGALKESTATMAAMATRNADGWFFISSPFFESDPLNLTHPAEKTRFTRLLLERIDRGAGLRKDGGMETLIYPRSPREMMAGWVYLPRFVDKIRLHLAGKLHADYQENFTKGFDAAWLKSAGVSAETIIEAVKNSITDGQVADWVATNVKKTEADKKAFADFVLNRGRDDEAGKARLKMRKEQAGLGRREDIQTFVDFIDADEKRL